MIKGTCAGSGKPKTQRKEGYCPSLGHIRHKPLYLEFDYS